MAYAVLNASRQTIAVKQKVFINADKNKLDTVTKIIRVGLVNQVR